MNLIPVTDFHRLPEDTPQRDTNLEHGELIVAIDLPVPAAAFAPNSYYLKVRDRASYAFALIAVAAALDISGGRIRQARIVADGTTRAHIHPSHWGTAKLHSGVRGCEEKLG